MKNKLIVTCLSDNSESKIGKPIKNDLDLFFNTSLNHMSIRSRLVSQPNIKLISNSEQLFNATDLSHITSVYVYLQNDAVKFQQYLEIILDLWMRI